MNEYTTFPHNKSNTSHSTLPAIQANNRKLRNVTKDAIGALERSNNPPIYFLRGGSLVRFRTDEHDMPLLETINESMLIGRLARVANFYSLGAQNEIRDCDPPAKVAKDIIAKGSWSFPPIVGIVEAPVLRPEGSIMMEQGYDNLTGLYYYPAPGFEMDPIPDIPMEGEVIRAKELLLEVFQDFPFKDDGSKANMLGLLITPLVRPAINGNIPLALITAPSMGTGKTKLGSIVSQIATGHEPSMMPYSQESEEMRKKVTSLLRVSANVIVMDNITVELNSEILSSVLTTALWGDRLLGKNEMLRLPQRAIWIANGNNLRIGGDLPRRCYSIELDAKISQPWKRTGFHHSDLVEWVIAKRPELMRSVFILVRAWVSKGKPTFSEVQVGGFSQWVNIVGGILNVVGIEGFLSNQEYLYNSVDEEGSQWEAFLLAIEDCFHQKWFTTAQASDALLDEPNLVDALPDELGSPFRYDGGIEHRFKQKLGIELKKRIQTRFGTSQVFIESERDEHLKIARWRIVRGVAGTRGTSNTNSENQGEESTPEGKVPALPAVPASPENSVDC
jgi:hypothetical protein